MTLYGIVCSVCHVRGIAPVDMNARRGADPYVSDHGWALCTAHADQGDPRHPGDRPPRPFLPDETDHAHTAPLRP